MSRENYLATPLYKILDPPLAIREFVLGQDAFVMLPTSSGKSLCCAALPYVFFGLLRDEKVLRSC